MHIKQISKEINKNAQEKGFWAEGIDVPQKLMLIVSELSEALEAIRKDKFADVFNFKEAEGLLKKSGTEPDIIKEKMKAIFEWRIKDTFEDELADATIRLFDLAEQMGIDLEWHVQKKHEYNTTRPYLHGKKF